MILEWYMLENTIRTLSYTSSPFDSDMSYGPLTYSLFENGNLCVGSDELHG